MASSERYIPVRYVPQDDGQPLIVCGLCGMWVWFLERVDSPGRERWPIDSVSSPDGRCEIINGGFRVLDRGLLVSALALNVPLYQAHPSSCTRRVRLVARVLDEVVSS